MSNVQHIEIALAGSESIQKWKRTNPGNSLDLSGANLRRIKLIETDLSNINFEGANLEWADFRWSDFINSNLIGTNISRADFHKADLTKAKLNGANLQLTNFEDTNLSYTDLTSAVFGGTRLLSTDMTNVIGLDTIEHPKTSIIDQETIEKATDLPATFLSGCGLSDKEVRLLHKRLVSSEVFSDFLEEASYLLAEGYKDAAAVMIGSVLEQNIRQLCQENKVEIYKDKAKKKHISANEMNSRLKKEGIYNNVDSKNIESCMGLRNCAAHGHYDDYTQEQVENMLNSVCEFLARVKSQVKQD